MKSKTALFDALHEITGDKTYVEKGLAHPSISNETYGKKSYVYVHRMTAFAADVIAYELDIRGFEVDSRVKGRVDVRVSYFKGHHWDE